MTIEFRFSSLSSSAEENENLCKHDESLYVTIMIVKFFSADGVNKDI